MSSSSAQNPIVLIVFNRPAHTEIVFEAIRKQRPSDLFVIADGPRMARPSDDKLCEEVRSIVSKVDWPCNVRSNFSGSNLGPKERVGSGLDWVFNQVDRAIILEDDCLPNPDFFRFCQELLEKHNHDHRVMAVTGNNFQRGVERGTSSYYFSKYFHGWGWATWRRAWKKYEPDMPFWRTWRESEDWHQKFRDPVERFYWRKRFDRLETDGTDAWDYPFLASIWKAGALTATPNVNLVSNIGFDEVATNTKSSSSWLAGIPTQTLGEIRHPDRVEQNLQADRLVFDNVFDGRNLRFPRIVWVPFWVLLRKIGNCTRRRIGRNESA